MARRQHCSNSASSSYSLTGGSRPNQFLRLLDSDTTKRWTWPICKRIGKIGNIYCDFNSFDILVCFAPFMRICFRPLYSYLGMPSFISIQLLTDIRVKWFILLSLCFVLYDPLFLLCHFPMNQWTLSITYSTTKSSNVNSSV